MPAKFDFPLSIEPEPPEPYCRYPYMYIDTNKSTGRRRFYSKNKYPAIKNFIADPVYFSQTGFRNLLNRMVNEEELDPMNQVTIYFALNDQNYITLIFSVVSPKKNKRLYFIATADGNDYTELYPDMANQWKSSYVETILPKLQGGLYHDPNYPNDSPTDTTSIDYDLIGLCQLDREMDYQKIKNNVETVRGISVFISSCRTKDIDPRKEFSCIPQRLITQFEILEEIEDGLTEFDISTMPDFKQRKMAAKLPTGGFDTGNICPPRC